MSSLGTPVQNRECDSGSMTVTVLVLRQESPASGTIDAHAHFLEDVERSPMNLLKVLLFHYSEMNSLPDPVRHAFPPGNSTL